ncbi:type I glyceraldehyde-3-phosphate dehydrogenase [Candidatus Parcubacteria bacterium]|nr:MAG: type I glyceraldehyde-3-phosphate dehydrogenase [Candidatus Parcubacteria bacterium]
MRIAINGFGRIGRIFFRQAFEHKGIEIVVINDLGDANQLAYLLKYDSVYGRYAKEVGFKNGNLIVDGKNIKFISEKEATKLPWKDLKIDVVVESTGVFESFQKAKAHIDAGAKRVVITAPAKDEESEIGRTILMGVNEHALKTCLISSNGSCTTNSAHPVAQVLSENPGIEKAVLNTVHGYTATQSLVDGPSKGDWRRGRAAAHNIVPSTTGAAISVARAVENLKGKFDGVAMRVPVIAGSMSDFTFIAKRKTSAEEINDILRKASQDKRWQGIFKVTEEQIVSSDILGEPYGAIVDLGYTKVVDNTLVKVLSWYDNEWGYTATLVCHVLALANYIK